MASITDAVEGVFESPTGILLGIGALVVAPVALPAIGRVLRPATKLVFRGYLAAADYLSEATAEVRERASDLMAEAEADRKGRGRVRAGRAG